MKPHICPKCDGNKQVRDRYPYVNLCDKCTIYFCENHGKYMPLSRASSIFSVHYCDECKAACKNVKWYEDCNICSATGIVWEPK